MAKARKRIRWTPADLKSLKTMAGKKSTRTISKTLKRSEAAIRFKAHMIGISLALK